MGSHLQHPAHSDTARLTCPHPKMIFVTYISDAHPLEAHFTKNVTAVSQNEDQKVA